MRLRPTANSSEMMDRMEESACSDSVLVNPVLVAMAVTNSAFLKLITSSSPAPFALSSSWSGRGAIAAVEDVAMPRAAATTSAGGGVNASTTPVVSAAANKKSEERIVLIIIVIIKKDEEDLLLL